MVSSKPTHTKKSTYTATPSLRSPNLDPLSLGLPAESVVGTVPLPKLPKLDTVSPLRLSVTGGLTH